MAASVIAERALHVAGEPATMILLKLYAPENIPWHINPELFPWRCAYTFEAKTANALNGHETSCFGYGRDSFEALLAALLQSRCYLDRLFEEEGRQYTWAPIANVQGGHAIPYPIYTDVGPTFEREMIDLMWKEQRAFIFRERDGIMKRIRGELGDSDRMGRL